MLAEKLRATRCSKIADVGVARPAEVLAYPIIIKPFLIRL